MKYRKKPVVIEAYKYDGFLHTIMTPQWLIDAYVKRIVYYGEDDEVHIQTLEGDHRVSLGDYIIQGVQGELYPCKPDIFEATYEPV